MRYIIAEKIKSKKVVTITLMLLVLVALPFVFFVTIRAVRNWYYPIGSIEITAKRFARGILVPYISANNGVFPMSEDDLLNKKFLKKAKIHDGNEYYLKLGPSEFGEEAAYHKNVWFKFLRINYGARVENIEVRGGKLYDKSTKKQVLLIDGPYKQHLQKRCYESVSLHLYELMLKEKQKAKEQEEPLNNIE